MFKKITNIFTDIFIWTLLIGSIIIITHGPGWLIFFNYLKPVTYFETYASIIGVFSLAGGIIKALIYIGRTVDSKILNTIIEGKLKYLSKNDKDELI